MPILIVITLIVLEVLIIIVHLTVYAALAAAFGIGSIWLKTLFVILAFTFVSASFLSHFVKSKFIDRYYTFSVYWLGLVHFLFEAAVVFYFTLVIFYLHNIYVSPALIGGIAFGTVFLIHLYGTVNSQRPKITSIKVAFSKLPGFQADCWKGKKIVFVSDFQLGNVYREGFTARVVRKIKALDPYVVIIGGDLYDGVRCDEEKIIAPLRDLHPPGGTYFITGNHEYYSPRLQEMLAAVRQLGIVVLDDKKMTIGGIDVIGVDYRSTHKRADYQRVLAGIGVDRTRPSILLKHEPSDLDVAEQAGISLELSGHTHHGQMFPLMFFTWQMYHGFDYGLKRLRGMQVFTTSGVGTWGPPLRLGTKSEIVEIEFG